MSKKSKLKGTRIFTVHDITQQKKRNREELVNEAKDSAKEGYRLKVGYNKIRINEDEFLWTEQKNKWYR